MKKLLFMLAVVGIVLFACGTKDSEDSLEIKNISAHDKAMEIAEKYNYYDLIYTCRRLPCFIE